VGWGANWETKMSVRLIKLAVIYLVAGMSLGIWMGIAQDHTLRGVHAHINLLGWATLALTAVVFHVFPDLARTRLAAIWFWVYNLSLPVAMISLAFMLYGDMRAAPAVKISHTFLWLGGVLFAANVLINLREQSVARAAALQASG
jgi:hypothetical protein